MSFDFASLLFLLMTVMIVSGEDNKTEEVAQLTALVEDLRWQIKYKDLKIIEQRILLEDRAHNILYTRWKNLPYNAPRELKKQVQEYTRTKDWNALRRSLEDTMSNNRAYSQLETIDYDCAYPLWSIGRYAFFELMEELLAGGLSVNAADKDGYSMLHGAGSGGQTSMARMLVTYGADLEARDGSGWTPLVRAANNGKLETVQYLVEAGAKTTARCRDNGGTALDLAKYNNQTSVVDYLSQLPH